ncbi:MAG: EAL domain-containing protein [Actinomycetota bacterium]|nr:EAL domain-containing protein [Actinomycetota bacterium]
MGPEYNTWQADASRRWAETISTAVYLPISGDEVEWLLREMLGRLVDALGDRDPQAGLDVGAELVDAGLTGGQGIRRTIEVLGAALPSHPALQEVDGLAGRILGLLGALAAGYADELRRRTFEQQESVSHALIKAKQSVERVLRVSEARFRELFISSALGIAITELDATVVESNRALSEMLGYSAGELTERKFDELFHPDDATSLAEAYRWLADGEGPRFRMQCRLRGKDGETVWTYLAVSVLHDADGRPVNHVTMVEDVTDLSLLQRRLSHQALHDLLTGLPNQQYFGSRLAEVLECAGPSDLVALAKVDIDNFAVINDGIGHEAGDALLKSVAARLQGLVSDEVAMVARIGADEFAMLIEGSVDVTALAARINSELAEPIHLNEHGLAVSAGIGVVQRPAREITPAELVREADTTLHRVKRGGGGHWAPYDADRDATDRARYRLAAAMPVAWENGEVSLRYQPLIGLNSNVVVGVQALLRWDHPDQGTVPHEQCLELAEQTGLVLSLGRWLLRGACEQFASWAERLQVDAPPVLHVDLTPHLSQDPDLIAVVRATLTDTGVPPQQLRLGVQLPALSGGRGDTEDNVRVLGDIGAGVVLLGAYAEPGCLRWLEDLPVRAVEIAPSLVRRLAGHPEPGSVVMRAAREAVPLLHHADALVIVPVVDTAAQADFWRSTGADAARGDQLISPGTAEEIGALLTHRS